MWNTTNNNTDVHYHEGNKTIVEKKAPTDESLKLLKEMQNKATNAIIDRHIQHIPKFNTSAEWVVTKLMAANDFATFLRVKAIYNINNEEFTYSEDFELRDVNVNSIESLREHIFGKIAKQICNEIFMALTIQGDFTPKAMEALIPMRKHS